MAFRILLLSIMGCATLLLPIGSSAEWRETSYTDEMTSQKARVARVLSTNAVTFGFPYGGPQHAALSVRKHPRYGNDVILSLEKAQFLCHLDSCEVLVRFDNGDSKQYSASEPADHSSNTLFLHDYESFVSNLINAKQVKIEAQFYQAGPRIFTFNIARLPATFSQEIIEARNAEEKRRSDEVKHERQEALRLQREAEESVRQAEESKRQADAAAKAALPKIIDDWRARIQAKISGRIVVPPNVVGNPEVRFKVVLLPGGEVLSANLKKTSGNPAYDAAVERAINAAQPLPVPDDTDLFQENFRELYLSFYPRGNK